MAIPQLTDEQISTWSVEQKDRWWLANVFRGDMAQLTVRSAAVGFVIGGLLSATNLYVGAKTGWTLGVGLTSVIVAFAAFKVISTLDRTSAGRAFQRIVVGVAGLALVLIGVLSMGRGVLGWALTAAGLIAAVWAVVSLVRRRPVDDFTILENNAMQSIATAAGYMTGPLIGGIAAYMWIENKPIPFYQIFGFNVVLSVLGVLVAFPMKRRFINDEQQPFPEGRACGVVLDTLYTSDASVGIFKAKALAIAAGLAGLISFISGDSYLRAIRALFLWVNQGGPWGALVSANKKVLDATWHLPHELDKWVSWMIPAGAPSWLQKPVIAGVPMQELGLRPGLDLAMFGAGGLMGIKSGISMMVGMLINFVIIVPWMINVGEIQPQMANGVAKLNADGGYVYGRAHILNSWALWYGIVLMVVASMVALFAKPQVFVEAFKALTGKKKPAAGNDVLKHIELPLWVSFVGMPIFGAIGVWMAWAWFGVPVLFGALAVPLVIVLSLIAASSTAMTGITPSGSLSKIPQFIFGAANPKHAATNLMTGVMSVEVSSNAANLLMDIKPGYMLGAKPRQQAIGHIIGIVSGALASTPLFYVLFLSDYSPIAAATDPMHVQKVMSPEGGQFGFPGAVQWKGVSELVTSIFGGASSKTLLTASIIRSMVIAAVVALIMEIARIRSKGKFPLSPLAIGLGVVVPPDSTIAMFAGALFFWAMHRVYHARKQSFGHRLWIDTHEPICAGIVAGAALIGIGDTLVKVFLLR
ncbi:MAG TPA: OPT/YSL family transporter [Phycisphaerales bacterium]|nr:OPT/YSL family transporter [Phycisphaerales bacterium]